MNINTTPPVLKRQNQIYYFTSPVSPVGTLVLQDELDYRNVDVHTITFNRIRGRGV